MVVVQQEKSGVGGAIVAVVVLILIGYMAYGYFGNSSQPQTPDVNITTPTPNVNVEVPKPTDGN